LFFIRSYLSSDKQQQQDPFLLQLANGSVEETQIKGHEHCIKLANGETQVFLGFANVADFDTWLAKCRRVS
jgi:hypothetical protein